MSALETPIDVKNLLRFYGYIALGQGNAMAAMNARVSMWATLTDSRLP